MEEKVCRLCFKHKINAIGIYTAAGSKLKIDRVIEQHFGTGEVRADDIFPKWVCTLCWGKVEVFHNFYLAVEKATNAFMQNIVKVECPSIVEDSCDSVRCKDDYFFSEIKSEPMDFDFVDVNSSPSGSRAPGLAIPALQKSNERRPIVLARQSTPSDGSTKSSAQLISELMNMTCFYCGLGIKTLPELIVHNENEHGDEYVPHVKCCDIKLGLTDLNDHVEYHRNPLNYKCVQCDKHFPLGKMLRRHQHQHADTPPKRFECDICNKKFMLMQHVKGHIIAKHTRTCKICKKSLLSKRGLAEHVRVMHEQKHSVCPICDKNFDSIPKLIQHLETYGDNIESKSYAGLSICPICGIEFRVNANIGLHLDRHCTRVTARARIMCEKCGKSYKNMKALSFHKIVHKDEGRVFPCSFCPLKCVNINALKSHIRRHHKQ